MTAAEKARQYGLTVAEVARITKQHTSLFYSWNDNKPELYDAVLRGVKQLKQEQ